MIMILWRKPLHPATNNNPLRKKVKVKVDILRAQNNDD